jgi:hypothetical protein
MKHFNIINQEYLIYRMSLHRRMIKSGDLLIMLFIFMVGDMMREPSSSIGRLLIVGVSNGGIREQERY